MIDHIADTLACLDVGLQTSPGQGANVGVVCWRCSSSGPVNTLDLCAQCNDWLHCDDCFLPLPPSAPLHPSLNEIPGL